MVFSGSVKARTESTLGFRVAGKIVERAVNIGDHVEAGTVLARLDATDLVLSLEQRRGRPCLGQTRRDVAQSEFGRNQTLAAKGFVTKSVSTSASSTSTKRPPPSTPRIHPRPGRQPAAYAELKATAPAIAPRSAPMLAGRRGRTQCSPWRAMATRKSRSAVPENKLRLFQVGERSPPASGGLVHHRDRHGP